MKDIMKQSILISNRKYKAMKAVHIWVWPAVLSIWAVLVSASNIYEDFHSFNQIELTGPVEILLVHGEEAAVSQQRCSEKVSIIIEDKILKIQTAEKATPSIIKVTYENLQKLSATKGAIVTAREAIKVDELNIELDKKAQAALNFKAGVVKASAQGDSKMTAVGKISDFTADFHNSELEHRQLNAKKSTINVNNSTAYNKRN